MINDQTHTIVCFLKKTKLSISKSKNSDEQITHHLFNLLFTRDKNDTITRFLIIQLIVILKLILQLITQS